MVYSYSLVVIRWDYLLYTRVSSTNKCMGDWMLVAISLNRRKRRWPSTFPMTYQITRRCRSLSIIVDHCRSLSIIVDHCRSLKAAIHESCYPGFVFILLHNSLILCNNFRWNTSSYVLLKPNSTTSVWCFLLELTARFWMVLISCGSQGSPFQNRAGSGADTMPFQVWWIWLATTRSMVLQRMQVSDTVW